MSTRRWLPLVLAVAGLLAVAALASHGHPLSRSHGSGPTPAFFDYVLTTVVIAVAGLALLFLLALRRTKPGARPRGEPRWRLLQLLAMLLLSAVIAAGLLHGRLGRGSASHLRGQPGNGQTATAASRKAPKGRNARLRWDEIAVVIALLAAAGVVAYATRTTPAKKEWRFRPREEIALALDESLDDLRNEPDVRRAIIAAYARMERSLAAAGIPRRPSEAPLEYMARALQQLDASSPAVARLTDLFEWAKFSHHDPDESMRNEAIAALVAVRDELRKPVEVAA